MLNAIIIILFVLMIVGSYIVAKIDNNFGRKIFWASAIVCAAILFLTGCGSENKVYPASTPKVEEKTPEQTSLSTNQTSYDMLQQFFLTLNQNVTMKQIEDIISQNKIPHTSWSSSDHSITYRIAYRQSDAMRLHGTSGDYLDITFNDGDKKIREWHYYNNQNSADAYFFTLPFVDNKVQYIGYVYHDYEMKKQSAHSITYSNYYQCSSGEEVIARVLKHQR